MITKHFGEVDIDESIVLTFEEGLPGFSEEKKFILLEENKSDDDDGMFMWLQSITNGDLAFVLMDVLPVLPDYNPILNKEDIQSLGEFDPDNFMVYNIVVIPENINKLSVNLKAPIIINLNKKKGKQVIATNEDYSVKYYIFEELKKKKAGGLDVSSN